MISLSFLLFTDSKSQGSSTQNIPIIEGGTNSGHMHNLAKSQSYQGLNFFTKWH